jgi:hypothetical protein
MTTELNILEKTIEDHEKRIAELEKKITPKKENSLQLDAEKTTLTDRILELRTKGFFNQAKVALEVFTEISKTYSCEKNRVDVCLTKMGTRRQLRVTSKTIGEKQYKAYAW